MNNKAFKAFKVKMVGLMAGAVQKVREAEAAGTAEALKAWYLQAQAAWRAEADWAAMTKAAQSIEKPRRLFGDRPLVRDRAGGWACPLNWEPVGTVYTVPVNKVLVHKQWVRGRCFQKYFAPGTRCREVSKGCPTDEAVWEVLPPA